MTTSAPPTRRPYDAPVRRRAAAKTRAAVLAAFNAELTARGYRATTLRAVAERAGVSAETVYKSFGSKAALLKSLWDVTQAGDDASLTMAQRPELTAVLQAPDLATKTALWAAFAQQVNDRLAPLSTLMTQAGPGAADVLVEADSERLRGVTAFVEHLHAAGLIGDERRHLPDTLWALTSASTYTQLRHIRGWNADSYQAWLTTTLVAILCPAPARPQAGVSDEAVELRPQSALRK